MRQKAYLDEKINFEKLKRGAEFSTTEPAKPRATAPPAPKAMSAPVQKPAPAIGEKIPKSVNVRPRIPEISRTKMAPVPAAKKSFRSWVFWLLLAAAAGLIL